jgi:hypothetical protein
MCYASYTSEGQARLFNHLRKDTQLNMKFDLMNTQKTIQNDPDLTPAQKGFLFVASRCTDNNTAKVKNSQENLAHYAQINPKTVSKWLTQHEEVKKYFVSKKRGRMLDLWFKEEVETSGWLKDTLPSKLRDEAPETPSEMDYQTVAEQSQSDTPSEMTDTPSEIPNTPSEMTDTPSEVEPSTITSTLSSTLSSTKTAGADAPSLNSRDNETQGRDEEIVEESVESSLVIDSNPSEPSLEEINAFFDSFLASSERQSSAPAAPAEEETRPAAEDITMDDFLAWAEEASEEEQLVAVYGLEHKKYDALQKVILVAEESKKPEYDWCNNEAQRYTYAEQNVSYDGPGRKSAVASINDSLGEW